MANNVDEPSTSSSPEKPNSELFPGFKDVATYAQVFRIFLNLSSIKNVGHGMSQSEEVVQFIIVSKLPRLRNSEAWKCSLHGLSLQYTVSIIMDCMHVLVDSMKGFSGTKFSSEAATCSTPSNY